MLFLYRIEIEKGFFYVSGFFELAGMVLYGISLKLFHSLFYDWIIFDIHNWY